MQLKKTIQNSCPVQTASLPFNYYFNTLKNLVFKYLFQMSYVHIDCKLNKSAQVVYRTAPFSHLFN